MSEYLLTAVSEGRTWTWDGKTFEDFTLMLESVDKPAILTQKPGTPVPKVGEKLDLDLVQHPRFEDKMKAKRVRQNVFGGGPRPEDPKRAARILRQHSQDMALRTIALGVDLGVIVPEAYPQNPADLFDLIRKTADWFDKDAEAAAS